MPDQVTTMLAAGLQRVEESIARLSTDLHTQLSRLPELYLTQREAERRFADYKIDIEALELKIVREASAREAEARRLTGCLEDMVRDQRAEREADEQRHAAERAADEKRRADARRWAIGLAVPTLLTLIGLVLAVLTLMAKTT